MFDMLYIMMLFFIIFSYPLHVGALVNIALYFVYKLINKKRINRGKEEISNAVKTIYFVFSAIISLVIIFLCGLISFGIKEVLSWNFIPASVGYIVYGVIYAIGALISSKCKFDDEESQKQRKRTTKLCAFGIALFFFVMAQLVGISYVAMTAM